MGEFTVDSFQSYLSHIATFDLLTPPQEIELAEQISKGDQQAATTLFEHNLRLVVRIAKRYAYQHISLPDLVAEGNIGLWRAVWRYDPYRRYEETGKFIRFSTCAEWWIKQAILRTLQYYGTTACYPNGAGARVAKVLRLWKQGYTSVEVLAQESGFTPDDVRNVLAMNVNVVSMESPLGLDQGTVTTWRDLIPESKQEHAPSPYMSEHLEHALEHLSDLERVVIEMSYGFAGKDYSLKDIAERVNRSREGVRKIRLRALEKLKDLIVPG